MIIVHYYIISTQYKERWGRWSIVKSALVGWILNNEHREFDLKHSPPPSLASSHHRDDEQHPATLLCFEMLFNRTFCLLHDVGT